MPREELIDELVIKLCESPPILTFKGVIIVDGNLMVLVNINDLRYKIFAYHFTSSSPISGPKSLFYNEDHLKKACTNLLFETIDAILLILRDSISLDELRHMRSKLRIAKSANAWLKHFKDYPINNSFSHLINRFAKWIKNDGESIIIKMIVKDNARIAIIQLVKQYYREGLDKKDLLDLIKETPNIWDEVLVQDVMES